MSKQLSPEYIEFVRINELHEAVCERWLGEGELEDKVVDFIGDEAWKALEKVCDRPVRSALDVYEIGEIVRARLFDDDGEAHSTCPYLEGALLNAVRALAETEGVEKPGVAA